MFKDGLHLIEYAELVEIEVNAIQAIYKFPQNNENIERGICEKIVILSSSEVNRSPKERIVVSTGVLVNSFLRLFNKNRNSFFDVPMYYLWYPNINNANNFYLNNFNVNFSLSSIYVNQLGQSFLNTNNSFLILFIYSENK